MDTAVASFSTKLRTVRRERSLSQQRLADLACLSQAAVSRYERGTRQPPMPALTKIASALGLREAEFVLTPDEIRGLTPIVEAAIYRIRSGETLPSMPGLANAARCLGVDGWHLLATGIASTTESA